MANPVSAEQYQEIVDRVKAAGGSWEQIFEEVEKLQHEGLTRYFMAECRVCVPRRALPFEDLAKRNEWASKHSKLPIDKNKFPDGLFGFHNVKVYEEWR